MKTKTILIFVYLVICLCRVMGTEPARDSESLAQLIDKEVGEYSTRKLTREELDVRFPDDMLICALPKNPIYGADLKITVIALCSLASPRGPQHVKTVCSYVDSKGQPHEFHVLDGGRPKPANQALVPTPASVTPAAGAPVAPDAGAAHL